MITLDEFRSEINSVLRVAESHLIPGDVVYAELLTAAREYVRWYNGGEKG